MSHPTAKPQRSRLFFNAAFAVLLALNSCASPTVAEISPSTLLATTSETRRTLWVIPKMTLERPLYLTVRLSRGAGALGLQSGLPVSQKVVRVRFVQSGGRLLLVRTPDRLQPFDAGSVTSSFAEPVLVAANIIRRTRAGDLIADLDPWLVGPLLLQSEWGASWAVSHLTGVRIDPARSRLRSAAQFADRAILRVEVTFELDNPLNLGQTPTSTTLTVEFAISLALAPATPMPARVADSRVNFYTTETKRFDGGPGFGRVQRLITRWRLAPRTDGSASLTIYIDPTVPAAYAGAVRAGVEAWNEPFAAIGFPRALEVRPLPEGADPFDPHFPTIHWISSDRRTFVGSTPCISDPLSGEIVDCNVILDGDLLRRFSEDYAALGGEVHLDRESGEVSAPEEVLQQAVRWMVMHEVGHLLGMRHNFRASTAVPFARLTDDAWIAENGLSASIMDYPGMNWPSAGPSRYLFTPRLGAQDFASIAFGYASSAEQALVAADRAASFPMQAEMEGDTDVIAAEDPLANPWDLGDDPLAWAIDRDQRLQAAFSGPAVTQMPPAVGLRIRERIFDHRVRLLGLAAKYIGTDFATRDLGLNEQRALEFLEREGLVGAVYASLDTRGRTAVRNDRPWADLGLESSSARLRISIRLAEARESTLAALFDTNRLRRMSALAPNREPGRLALTTLFQSVSAAVWRQGAPDGEALRAAWIRHMAGLMNQREAGLEDARSLAIGALRSIRSDSAARHGEPLDAALAADIDRALAPALGVE
jgi:hypothetical protein